MSISQSVLRLSIAVLAIGGLIAVLAVLPSGCTPMVNRFAFYPTTGLYLNDSSLPPGVKHLTYPTEDGETIEGYFVPPTTRPDRLILYFHGNGGNVAQRLAEWREMAARTGAAVLASGYRGYGTSTGKPTEPGIYRDGEAALRHAQETLGFTPERIVLVGRSLGSTVATHLAARDGHGFDGVILVTPLSTGRDFGRAHMGPISVMAGRSFDSLGRAAQITEPVLILHGSLDEVVPYENGQKLFAALAGPKRFVTIPGGHHNDLEFVGPRTYWDAFAAFVAAPAKFVATSP